MFFVLPDIRDLWALRGPEVSAFEREFSYGRWSPGAAGIKTFDRKHPEVMPEALEAGNLKRSRYPGTEGRRGLYSKDRDR